MFLGAGFSKWAADLPLVDKLFDFAVKPFGVRDASTVKKVQLLRRDWDMHHPFGNNEEFIAYAIQHSEQSKNAVLRYLVLRLSQPFIWAEFHSFRWRRHVLMFDEYRKYTVPGVTKPQNFLQGFVGVDVAGIITTNYDTLVEYVLGTKGFNYGVEGEILVGRGPYPVSTWLHPVRLTGKMPIAKLHGSISWDSEGHYTDGRRGITGNALIVPPTPAKALPERLQQSWQLATRILSATTRIAIFGFSFNQADQSVLDLLGHQGSHIQSVLLVDISPKRKEAVRLWPNARIQACYPPPEGKMAISAWKNRRAMP